MEENVCTQGIKGNNRVKLFRIPTHLSRDIDLRIFLISLTCPVLTYDDYVIEHMGSVPANPLENNAYGLFLPQFSRALGSCRR